MKKTKLTVKLDPGEAAIRGTAEAFNSLLALCEMAIEGAETTNDKAGWEWVAEWIRVSVEETLVPFEDYEEETWK